MGHVKSHECKAIYSRIVVNIHLLHSCEFCKAALLFWFFGDFRCGALLFMVIHVIYKYKNK